MTIESGKALESLAAEVFSILCARPGLDEVVKDVLLDGADRPRQIDVAVRTRLGPVESLTVIECKDHRRKVDVTTVDAWHSVMADVGANKGVIVTRSGFSGTARKKAKRLGISLLVADHLSNLKSEVAEVAVHVRELRQTAMNFRAPIYLEGGTTIDKRAFLSINDRDLIAMMRDSLLSDPDTYERIGGQHIWVPTDLTKPYFIRDIDGNPLTFDEMEVTYTLTEQRYFGYLSDVDSVIYLHDVTSDDRTILVSEDILANPYAHYERFASDQELPVEPQLNVKVLSVPTEEDVSRLSGSAEYLGPRNS